MEGILSPETPKVRRSTEGSTGLHVAKSWVERSKMNTKAGWQELNINKANVCTCATSGIFSGRRSGRKYSSSHSKQHICPAMSIKNALRVMCSDMNLALSKWDLVSIQNFNPGIVVVQGFIAAIRMKWK